MAPDCFGVSASLNLLIKFGMQLYNEGTLNESDFPHFTKSLAVVKAPDGISSGLECFCMLNFDKPCQLSNKFCMQLYTDRTQHKFTGHSLLLLVL